MHNSSDEIRKAMDTVDEEPDMGDRAGSVVKTDTSTATDPAQETEVSDSESDSGAGDETVAERTVRRRNIKIVGRHD